MPQFCQISFFLLEMMQLHRIEISNINRFTPDLKSTIFTRHYTNNPRITKKQAVATIIFKIFRQYLISVLFVKQFLDSFYKYNSSFILIKL